MFGIPYFSQIGEQTECEFKVNPSGHEHFSGATHSPNSHGLVHFGIHVPSDVKS